MLIANHLLMFQLIFNTLCAEQTAIVKKVVTILYFVIDTNKIYRVKRSINNVCYSLFILFHDNGVEII